MKATALVGALIVASVVATAAYGADKSVPVCPLLTSAEIGAAVGGTIGPPHEDAMAITEGPAKGRTMGMCNWPAGTQGGVSLAVTRAPQGAQREAELAHFNQAFQTLKGQGWAEERKDFTNGACVIMTPPPSAKGMPISSGCFAEAKGVGISVGHNGSAKVSMDRMKTLLDKAIGRLP